jgi:glutaredoxin
MINNVEIYTKPGCAHCVRAKKELNSHNIPYTEHVLDVNFTKEILLEKFPAAKTFPIIVIDGFNIGGYNQLVSKINEEFSNTQQLLNE